MHPGTTSGRTKTKVFDALQAWDRRPFRYGEDCCVFAASVVEAVTGRNPMAALQYTTKAQADAIIAQFGGLAYAVRYYMGNSIRIEDAQDGDVLVVDSANGPAAAIYYNGRAVVRTMRGIDDFPIEIAVMACRAS